MSKKVDKKKKNRKKRIKAQLKANTSRVKGTVSGKVKKKLDKVLEKNSRIPILEEAREICNCHNKKDSTLVSVDEIQKLDRVRFVPMLDEHINEFGKDDVRICGTCLLPTLSSDIVTSATFRRSVMIILSGIQIAKSSKKITKGEAKALYKLRNLIEDNTKVILKTIVKIEKKKGGVAQTTTQVNRLRGDKKNYSDVEE